MDEILPPTKATRVAIELLTLWMEPGDDARFHAAKHITRLLNEEEEDATTVIAGLLNLNMFSITHLAKERGATEADMLKKAGDILREWSPQLPE